MALLNAVTTQPLLGAAFNGTDALISLQANGRLYLAPQVSIKGQPGFVSGSVVDTTQPITFTVDLSGAPANASAALFFDLVSLNGAGSRASVANVQLSVNAPNNQPPWRETTRQRPTPTRRCSSMCWPTTAIPTARSIRPRW